MKRYIETLRSECPGFAAFLEHVSDSAENFRLDLQTGLPATQHAHSVLINYLCQAAGAQRPYLDIRRIGANDYDTNRSVYVPLLFTPGYFGPEHKGLVALTRAMRSLQRVGCAAFPALRAEMQYYVRKNFRLPRTPAQSLSLVQRLKKLSLDPTSFRYSRAVGVEIEGFNSLTREQMEEALPFWSRAVSDGSIRPVSGTHAHEVRALLPRDAMEPRLFSLCRKLSDVNFRVNASCGLHVHFDMRGRSGEEVKAKARIAESWLHALQELLPASRRGNEYCKWGISTTDRYRAVNLRAYQSHNTLEIRCHSGTIDYTKILAWIRLCELVLALRRRPKSGSCVGVLEQLPLAEHDRSYWLARHRALNPQQYPTNGSAETETA